LASWASLLLGPCMETCRREDSRRGWQDFWEVGWFVGTANVSPSSPASIISIALHSIHGRTSHACTYVFLLDRFFWVSGNKLASSQAYPHPFHVRPYQQQFGLPISAQLHLYWCSMTIWQQCWPNCFASVNVTIRPRRRCPHVQGLMPHSFQQTFKSEVWRVNTGSTPELRIQIFRVLSWFLPQLMIA
jgi:hypothetical protein